jgi:hypothetical protein
MGCKAWRFCGDADIVTIQGVEARFVEASSLTEAVVALVSLQALFMAADERIYHRRRGLARWERWGHPFDSLVYLAALAVPALAPPESFWIQLYIVLATVSSLLITKDEWVHAGECVAGEHWVHAVLFLVHPSILIFVGFLWLENDAEWLRRALPVLVAMFACYQVVHWRGTDKLARPKPGSGREP